MSLKRLIVNYFPFLGPVKQFVHALVDMLLPVKSYSQHVEDTFIIDFLSKNDRTVCQSTSISLGFFICPLTTIL